MWFRYVLLVVLSLATIGCSWKKGEDCPKEHFGPRPGGEDDDEEDANY
jgi:hypothetical protein